ncbi:MAG: metal-dependent hydrolase [Alphaproteobacteria bacterium]|nr:metal-dependent hydrolase [Alphaproteobacteria bacterium]
MASFGHIAVGLAAGRLYADRGASTRTLATAMMGFCIWSVLPDADVVAFALGIPYHAPFGHRGASHSLAVAAACGALVGLGARLAGRPRPLRLALFVAVVMGSHGLLDSMTTGGLGIALLWPASDARFFAPWRPIPVAPIGAAFLSPRGLTVALTEVAQFAPLWIWALWPRRLSRSR